MQPEVPLPPVQRPEEIHREGHAMWRLRVGPGHMSGAECVGLGRDLGRDFVVLGELGRKVLVCAIPFTATTRMELGGWQSISHLVSSSARQPHASCWLSQFYIYSSGILFTRVCHLHLFFLFQKYSRLYFSAHCACCKILKSVFHLFSFCLY